MNVRSATDRRAWDDYLKKQRFSPFLQSWTMGEVYADIGQEPIRLEAYDNEECTGICLAVVVPARRGKHLMVPYGPVTTDDASATALLHSLTDEARARGCSFIRVSPFLPQEEPLPLPTVRSPLHLLAEHLWYLPLEAENAWTGTSGNPVSEESLLAGMRKTTRNLIRRAGKEGVEVTASPDPVRDMERFIELHEETRRRHHFTPYSNAFFRAQVRRFAPAGNVTVYVARYRDEVIAASVHMHFGGETSYHHGASTQRFAKIPASYLLQWTAITDARKRGDGIYNFWGIAPMRQAEDGTRAIADNHHPFAGVTLFKTGFGGTLLNLHPCSDLPLSSRYHITRSFERLRKWKRGF